MMRLQQINVLVLVVLLLFTACQQTRTQKGTELSYPTMVIERSTRMLSSEYTATISGCQTVEIRPQVGGMITDICINEGDIVRKDSTLFVIDQAPYKAAYEIAVANVKSAEANLSTAKLVLESNKELFEKQVVSEFDLMTSQNNLSEAEAKLALACAQETNARNNLSYTMVKSPVNGVASMIPYRVGALVSSSISQPLVTVSDDSRVFAYFSMAENQMLDLIQQYGSLKQAIAEMPEVELMMSNGEIYSRKGRINAISGTINASTGTVSLRAVFPNTERLLRDGGSGTVVIPSVHADCIVIPQSATYELQERIFVYKVVDGKTESTQIKVAELNNGKEYIVASGLEVGDIIISQGAGLMRDGIVIQPQSEVQTDKE
jgi:membrane fusion protein (multidrug efflux system)